MSESIRDAEILPAERPSSGIVRPAGNVGEAVQAYREVQRALDSAMPDCIQKIAGRDFRKKNYWRGVATGFNLDVTLLSEERIEEGDDWGWIVTYRAFAPNGRRCDGDGSCFASEKARNQDTIHNVRAHAHTRAFNRAVSNLVGFGEVSAEEMGQEQRAQRQSKGGVSFGKRTHGAGTPGQITEPQAKRIIAIAREVGEKHDEHGFHVVAAVLKDAGLPPFPPKAKYDDALIHLCENVAPEDYDEFVERVQGWDPASA